MFMTRTPTPDPYGPEKPIKLDLYQATIIVLVAIFSTLLAIIFLPIAFPDCSYTYLAIRSFPVFLVLSFLLWVYTHYCAEEEEYDPNDDW